MPLQAVPVNITAFRWMLLIMAFTTVIAILQGIIYSRLVTVILEYDDLLSHIGSQVSVAMPCLSWLRFIVTSMIFNTGTGAAITI